MAGRGQSCGTEYAQTRQMQKPAQCTGLETYDEPGTCIRGLGETGGQCQL